MEMVDMELLKNIVQRTESELILFFVILVAIVIPVSIILLKHSKHRLKVECTRREQERERERNIIQVITSNTEIMAGVKAMLETNNATLLSSFELLHGRIDMIGAAINNISKPGKGRTA